MQALIQKYTAYVHDLDNSIKLKRINRIFAISSLAALAFTALFFIFPTSNASHVSADAPVQANLSTISIITESPSTPLYLVIKDDSGNFASSTDEMKAKFGVVTNNYTGYTLSITSDDDEGKLINSTTDTSFASIDTAISTITFDTPSMNGKWGYQPSKFNSSANTDFLPTPTTVASTIDQTDSANPTKSGNPISSTTSIDELTPNNYSIGIGARADRSTEGGVYASTFTITATGNPISYAITYADDSGDSTVEGLPPTQSSIVSDTTINLSNVIPTRANHTFLKWCLGTVSNNGTSCIGDTYAPGAEFTLDQTTGNIATLYAIWSPNIAIKTNTGISEVTLGTDTCDGTNPDAASIGCVVRGLEYGRTYTLSTTVMYGYTFSNWTPGSYGSIANISDTVTTFTVGAGPTTITPFANSNQYIVALTQDTATTPGSTSTTVTYGSANISSITNPVKGYTVSGFSTEYNNASGAEVSPSTSSLTNSYPFNGWYDVSGDTRIITTSGTLELNTPYTDGFGRWNVTNGATLYANWGAGTAVTLPTIVKVGHTCGWSTSNDTNIIQYTSGYAGLVPEQDMTLYGVCVAKQYTCYKQYRLQDADGAYPTDYTTDGSETLSYGATCTYEKTITDYNNNTAKSTSQTMGAGDLTVSLDMPRNTYGLTINKNDTYINSVSGAGTYRWGESVPISATLVADSIFNGWSQTAGTASSFIDQYSTNTYFTMPKSNATIYADGESSGTRYNITYSDTTGDSSVSNLPDAQSGITQYTSIDLSITIPTRSNYTFLKWCLGTVSNNGTYCTGTTYSSGDSFTLDPTTENVNTLYAVWSPNIAIRTNIGISQVTLSTTTCNNTDPDASSIGCIVTGLAYGSTYTLSANVIANYNFSSWSNTSYGSIADTSSVNTTFTVGEGPTTITPSTTSPQYIVTLDQNGATGSGSTSTTVTYGSANISSITNPVKGYTVSGFSTEYNNASGAEVSPSTSSLTNSYPFNGWYDVSGDTRIITTSGTLELNTPYTDGFGRWNVTNGATLYANWGAGTAVTLPTIVKVGHTCGWSTSNDTNIIQYTSGYAGLVPEQDMTLYGVCNINEYTCFKQYRLQNADGTYPENYTEDGSEDVSYSAACTYEKTITDYNNDTAKSTSATVYNSDVILSLDFPRNTYGLTINKNDTYISSVSGAGTYRWGESVPISATMKSGKEFSSWSQTAGVAGSFSDASSASTYFTMPKSNATIYADGEGYVYIQDFTNAMCQELASSGNYMVVDIRDSNDYTVRRLGDNCWMTQNLRYVGDTGSAPGTMIMKSDTSNIDTDKTLVYADLTNGSDYDEARIHVATSDQVPSGASYTAKDMGVWYNYVAASAGTIAGLDNTDTAEYSLCPAGWRLPTLGEIYSLDSDMSAFSPITSGQYESDGSLVKETDYGYWWGSTSAGGYHRYGIYYNRSSGYGDMVTTLRYDGNSIRCIRSS